MDDREYKGEFKDDLYHGYAIVKAPDRSKVCAYFEHGRLVELVDPRSPKILRLEQVKLDIDSFFEKSRQKLVEFDYFVNQNKDSIEKEANFHKMRDQI